MLRRSVWTVTSIAVVIAALAACSDDHARTTRSEQSQQRRPPGVVSSTPRVTSPASTVITTASETVVDQIRSNGVERSYRLHEPPATKPALLTPLVIVLHGAMGNAARVELRYHWDELADRDRFFVAYPQGLYDVWNPTTDPRPMDDVRFLTELIDHLATTLPVDPNRIFVAGMSNGGAMTYRLGCTLNGRIAALAAVEAPNPGCRPAGPASLIVVHGLADRQVSIDGAQRAITSWRDADSCPSDPSTTQTGLVTDRVWSSCARRTAVELYTVAGGGHEWPGSSPPLPGHDPPSTALDATQAIWAFFSRHAR